MIIKLLIRLLWPAALALAAMGARADVAFTSLYSFQVFTNGAFPNSLAKGTDGNFYGTTSGGGLYGGGTVFKITTNGLFTRLYFFTGGADGASPFAGLVQGTDGIFYGTTYYGGVFGYGTAFKITTNGVLTRLYSFTGGNDGASPEAALVQGSDGLLYGTTYHGGTNGYGGVFKITTNGAFTPLYAFTGGTDGANPVSALVQGSDGNFYGTASYGGTNNSGTLFKITSSGTFTRLHMFTGGDDGAYPDGGLVQGSDGSLYGAASGGATGNYGTVFKITINGAFTLLHSFTGGNDGGAPESALVQGNDGNFYGTASRGGESGHDQGVVYQITAGGVLTRLYSFTGNADGGYPYAPLAQGNDGNFYGAVGENGIDGRGILFSIKTNGVLSILYSFPGSHDGAYPYAPLVQGRDGNFYGTTSFGGANNNGVIFRISAGGIMTNFYSFTGGDDGVGPQAGLVQGSDGNFYGTATAGGMSFYGTVFKITTNGVLTTLHSFTYGDGANPAALLQGQDGNFYGTTASGGTDGAGTVFKITINGVFTNLYSFTGGDDGANVYAGLVQGSDGVLYGTTGYGGTNNLGTLFKITTNGAFTSLYSFTGGNDGANPYAGLAQASNGVLYGTTLNGGANDSGVVFKITTDGVFTSLYSFTGGDDAGYPYGTLLLGRDGAFYGTSSSGTNIAGAVFKITTNGLLTVLYSFTGNNDGAQPEAGLTLGTDGSFYGTTLYGGAGSAGTVFRITVAPAFKALTVTNRTLNLTWSTEPASRYQLQYNSDLSPANWINLGSPVTATGATLSAADPIANNSRRFYRVVLLPP
jgi:uncharacterized repeat protein (TIGR03803 family)